MKKIKIENFKFTCPMLNKTIEERGELNYGTCRICKFNILGQIVDDNVYCNYGSSSGGGSGSGEQQGGNENTINSLNDLSDVDINNPEDGQSLVYSSNTNSWTNDTVSGGGGYSDNTPDDPDELWTDYDQNNP